MKNSFLFVHTLCRSTDISYKVNQVDLVYLPSFICCNLQTVTWLWLDGHVLEEICSVSHQIYYRKNDNICISVDVKAAETLKLHEIS